MRKRKTNTTKQCRMLVIGAPVERAFVSVHPNHLRFRVPGEETPLGPTNSSFTNRLNHYITTCLWHLFDTTIFFWWPLAFSFFLFFSFFSSFFSFLGAFAPLHKRERKRKVLTHYKAPIKEEVLISTTLILSFFQQNHGVIK